MLCDCALLIAGRERLTSFSVEYKKGKRNLLDCAEWFSKGTSVVDMPLRRFLRKYEELSQFWRRRIIGMMETLWLGRRVVREN
ncbi:hypothetical protein TNCV_2143121 [Trichonephila clavipes]|nr:hypothetical protein TNCV_2143121 [Trichonephila clavipes]